MHTSSSLMIISGGGVKSMSKVQLHTSGGGPLFFRLGLRASRHILGKDDGFPGPSKDENLRIPWDLNPGNSAFTLARNSSSVMLSGMRAGMAEAHSSLSLISGVVPFWADKSLVASWFWLVEVSWTSRGVVSSSLHAVSCEPKPESGKATYEVAKRMST